MRPKIFSKLPVKSNSAFTPPQLKSPPTNPPDADDEFDALLNKPEQAMNHSPIDNGQSTSSYRQQETLQSPPLEHELTSEVSDISHSTRTFMESAELRSSANRPSEGERQSPQPNFSSMAEDPSFEPSPTQQHSPLSHERQSPQRQQSSSPQQSPQLFELEGKIPPPRLSMELSTQLPPPERMASVETLRTPPLMPSLSSTPLPPPVMDQSVGVTHHCAEWTVTSVPIWQDRGCHSADPDRANVREWQYPAPNQNLTVSPQFNYSWAPQQQSLGGFRQQPWSYGYIPTTYAPWQRDKAEDCAAGRCDCPPPTAIDVTLVEQRQGCCGTYERHRPGVVVESRHATASTQSVPNPWQDLMIYYRSAE